MAAYGATCDQRLAGRDAPGALEQFAVRSGGRFALAWARLLAWPEARLALGRLAIPRRDARAQSRPRCGSLTLDGPDAIGHPLLRRLKAVAFKVAAGMELAEARGLDPHGVTLQQAVHTSLAGL
jgi:hypothetical protein